MKYVKGDRLISERTNEIWEVIMTDKEGEMIVLSENGITWTTSDEDPEGFRPFESDKLETEDVEYEVFRTLDDIKHDLYLRHLEAKDYDVDKAIIATRAVMYGLFHEKECLNVE